MKIKNPLLTLLFALAIASLPAQTYEIYVCDAGNFNYPPWQIVKFDQNGDNPEVFIEENLAWPQDIVFLEDQNIALVSNLNTGQIAKFDATTGDFLGDFATGIGGPTRMKIGADGYLYVLQWGGNGTVLRYELDGTFVDEYTDMGVNTSIGIDWDADGNLYVSSYGGSLIRKYDAEGKNLGIFANSNLNGPTNIWIDDNGDVFALNWNGTTVSRFDSEGNFVESFITGLGQPEGVDFLPNGNILIGNGEDASVKMYDPEGNFLENLVEPGAAGLLQPNAVILREVEPSSAIGIATETHYLYPTLGTVFYLDADWSGTLQEVAVYKASGERVYQGAFTGHQVWDAAGQSEGVYIIVGTTSDQRMLSQKVSVQH